VNSPNDQPPDPNPDQSTGILNGDGPQGSWWRRFLAWGKTPNGKYTVGTLKYTGFGLMMVFFWLLWGDFLYTLLDGNIPGILPLKLKRIGANDQVNQILNRTIAYGASFLFDPLVSTRSDRARTRFGRRMPYLFWSTPFVGLFLVGIGCFESLTRMFTGGAEQASFMGYTLSVNTVRLIVLAVMIIGWDMANIFVGNVYWYLFNDVVPSQYLSRFLALFRIVGAAAGMAYSKWIFPHSLDHFQTIFVVAGIAYGVGFLFMVIFIREGEYPPPPPLVENSTKWYERWNESIHTYARECFCHRLYWFFYLASTCVFMSGMAGRTFNTIRNVDVLKISMTDLGELGFWTGLVALLLQYPAGWLADRWSPVRVYLIASLWSILGVVLQCAWVFVNFDDYFHNGNLKFMWVTSLAFMPLGAIREASELPMYMRILPKERYGQFCSANAMIRAFAMMYGSIVAGWFIASLEPRFGEWRYTWTSVWVLMWQVPGVVMVVLMYRTWKRLGGGKNYVPPVAAHDVYLPPLSAILGSIIGFSLGFVGWCGWLPGLWKLNIIVPALGWAGLALCIFWMFVARAAHKRNTSAGVT